MPGVMKNLIEKGTEIPRENLFAFLVVHFNPFVPPRRGGAKTLRQ